MIKHIKNKRWVLRIQDKYYKEIKELQEFYKNKIGIYPSITQLVELAINKLKEEIVKTKKKEQEGK